MTDTEARVEEREKAWRAHWDPVREALVATWPDDLPSTALAAMAGAASSAFFTAYDQVSAQRDAERERAERAERLAECEVKRRRLAQERLHDEHNRPDCDPCDCVTCCEVRAGKEQP